MTLPILHLTDFYKTIGGHRLQYPQGTNLVYSNLTPRKSRLEGVNHVVFFGLQYFIKEYLIAGFNTFFKSNKKEVVKQYKRRIVNALGGDLDVSPIERLHDLQYLPLVIKALPEGVKVPIGVPVLTMYNTHPEFFWLTNFIETMLLSSVWGASTSATVANEYRKIVEKYADETCDDNNHVQWSCHDFSARGVSSIETACMSGGAHLTSFSGTDTVAALDWLESYYNADSDNELLGKSINAEEHSTATAYGKSAEFDSMRRVLMEVYPNTSVSLIIDSYNMWRVIGDYLPKLKNIILNKGGKTVLRPDSSPTTPADIICGAETNITKRLEEQYWKFASKGLIQCLWDLFGGTINKKGYKVLNPKIGAIYGDSISLKACQEICQRLKSMGFASSNIMFGVGASTYQKQNRDTFGWACKTTYVEVNSEPRNVFKNPVTDDGEKKSLCGIINVYRDDKGEYYAKDRQIVQDGEYLTIFKNGRLLIEHDLYIIRKRVRQ